MGDDNIKIYLKEDFMNPGHDGSVSPFEEVYKYIDNPFELQLQIDKMAAIAKNCGVTNFKTVFKEYCKTMKMARNQTYAENATNFEGQELELATGPWQANDYGITKDGAYGSEIVACVHPIMPVERLVNIDTGIEKLRIAYKKGRQWRNRIFERRQLASASSIVGLADFGVAVTSENAKYLVQYIHDVENLNYEIIPEHNSVSRLGWIGQQDFSPYVDDLMFDGEAAFSQVYNAVKQHGSVNKWMKLVKQIRAENNVPTKIVLAASFASVLVEPCKSYPFFVHLWNGSGNGKTVALMLAASVWAKPVIGEYIKTFDSTNVGQEVMANFVNSLPLILDELQIQKDRKDFDKTIYKLSEGSGRTRGAKTGGLQGATYWRNCILTSGEAPISSSSSNSGAINRIVEVNTEGLKFFKDPRAVIEVITSNYGHAGRMFVEELMEPGNMELAREAQKTFFNKLSNKDITEKQVLAASLILAADALIDMFIFNDGNGLTVDEVTQFLSTHSEVSADRRALDWLMDWVAQNSKKFNHSENTQETWGKVDFDKVLIIRDIFNKACTENGYNPSSFLSYLRRENLIETEGRGFTKRVRMNGIKCQCVVLKIQPDAPEGFQEVPKDEQIQF